MKNLRDSKLFIPAVVVAALIIGGLLFYGLYKVYISYRMQHQPNMRIVLEVNIPMFLESQAKNSDEPFSSLFKEIKQEAESNQDSDIVQILKRKFQEKQIRMSRYYGSISDSDDDITRELRIQSDAVVDRDVDIIRKRLDQYGVYEPSVQKMGLNRIIVKLPVASVDEHSQSTIRSLFNTACLEFKLLKDPEISYKIMTTLDRFLAGKGINDSLEVAVSDRIAMSQGDTALLAKYHPFLIIARPDSHGSGTAYVAEDDRAKINRILSREDVKLLVPDDVQFLWSNKPAFNRQDGRRYYELFTVKATPELTGGVIVNARAVMGDSRQPEVTMEMNSEGAREWARITGANINKCMAIILDSAVYSAPRILSKITGGRSQITGMQSIEEAKILEIVLKEGAIPARLEIIKQEIVEPGK